MQLHYLLVAVVTCEWHQWRQSHVIHCRCNIFYSAITRVVNNYNIRTELRFLNRTEQNVFRTESEFFFFKTEQNRFYLPNEVKIITKNRKYK